MTQEQWDAFVASMWNATVEAGRRQQEIRDSRQMEGNYIDFVCDGLPGPDGPRFVELEDKSGRSIALGEWVSRSDGLFALRVPIANAPYPFCRSPARCAGKGYCPNDPACNN